MASPFAGLARFCLSRSRRSFSVGLRARGAGEGGEGCVEELSQHVLREKKKRREEEDAHEALREHALQPADL